MTATVSEDVNQTLEESTMNQQEKAERFTELMTRFTSVLGKILPDDVATRLAELRKEQTSDISRIVYDAMFDDLAAARRLNVPLCQDTGVIQYYIEVGANFPLLSEMRACLDEAVRRFARTPSRSSTSATRATTRAFACPGSTGRSFPTPTAASFTATWPAAAARCPAPPRC